MNRLTEEQEHQEDEYNFPYHYLDLKLGSYRFMWSIEYLNHMEQVKNLLKPYNSQLILDAGCGDGRFCHELSKENIRIVGVDFSKNAIGFAKSFNPDVEFFVQDLEDLNLKYKFDYVLLIETLEHFIPEKIPIILQNISNVLKKEGKLIVAVPSKNLPLCKKHYQHFTKESLAKTLESSFKVVDISGYSKTGYKRKIFLGLRYLGYFLYPLNEINFIKKFFIFLNNYYKKNLAAGPPDDCLGLIAVCEKRDK